VKERWIRAISHPVLADTTVFAIAETAFSNQRLCELEGLEGGLRNFNYRARTDAGEFVLRIYGTADAATELEASVARLVAPKVATARYLSTGCALGHRYAVRAYLPGKPLYTLLPRMCPASTCRLAEDLGTLLAAIHSFEFDRFGELDANLAVFAPFDWNDNPLVRYVRARVDAGPAALRLGAALTEDMLRFLYRHGAKLQRWSARPSLVHADFGPTNVVVAPDGTLAVIDWEFAFSGSPAFDFGNLLRPPLDACAGFEEALIESYRNAGGFAPDEWRDIARMADLTAWVELTSRADVHDIVTDDARSVIARTLADCFRSG